MAPPTPMHCSHESCDYVTPVNIPSYDLVLKALEIHNSSHLSQTRAVHEQVPKSEKPKRPVVTSAMSESDWTFFLHKWDSITNWNILRLAFIESCALLFWNQATVPYSLGGLIMSMQWIDECLNERIINFSQKQESKSTKTKVKSNKKGNTTKQSKKSINKKKSKSSKSKKKKDYLD